MKRLTLTSGGISRSRSKFKPIKKPLTNSYFDVGGELVCSAKNAILREKDLVTGFFTGREYKLSINNVMSNLPSQYKDIKSLDIVCRLRSQKKEIKSLDRQNFHKKYTYKYWITHFYYLSPDNEVEVVKNGNLDYEANEENNNFGKSQDCDEIVSNYLGKKDEVEKRIADKLCRIIGGNREVFTPDGDRVDLITTDFLIEVKASSNWDDAIGQILKYKIHFANHELIIFIFDNGLDVKVAKQRLIQVINSFVNVTIHVAISIKELTTLVKGNY